MSGQKVMKAALIDAYAQTHYQIKSGEIDFTLRVGVFSPQLDALQRAHKVSSSAFITAWNPCSISTDEADNQLAHASLIADLHAMGLGHINGIGIDPAGKWEGEESVLVIGIEESAALELGAAYRQNAIVYVGRAAIPRLLFPDF